MTTGIPEEHEINALLRNCDPDMWKQENDRTSKFEKS